jgi:hypothetical protein
MEINTNYPMITAYSCEEGRGENVVDATIRRSKSAADVSLNDESLALDERLTGVGKWP